MIKILLVCLLLVGCQTKQEGSKTPNTKTGVAYQQAYRDDSVCVATVFLEEDTIKAATLDELTYLSKEEYSGLITALETTTHKHIASKVENSEAYSKAMEMNGATNTIKENYEAICQYVIGKSATDLQDAINMKTDEEVVDLVAGCTLKSTKGYIEAIITACNQAK